MKMLRNVALTLVILLVPVKASAEEVARQDLVEVGNSAIAPRGWEQFCLDYAPECDVARVEPTVLELTADSWTLLQTVNWVVNHHVTYRSDLEHWGMVDKWNYAEDRFGDCEDFALLKRRELLAHGVPRSALLLTIVWATNGAHMVLTVKTDQGELILDQQTDLVVRWWERPYAFEARQSQEDPNTWVWLQVPQVVVGQK